MNNENNKTKLVHQQSLSIVKTSNKIFVQVIQIDLVSTQVNNIKNIF